MSKELIERGRHKVGKSLMAHHIKEGIPEKILEIVGATEAEYFGTTELSYFERDREINQFKFYRYENFELINCSYGAAVNTMEYLSEKIFIFSEEPEEVIKYYVAEIIN
ncbi:hypothetical protein AWM70_22255 [Paenibacillus yonginensis]|uniref:Uncharacterized protein n=1 Tax=Paenibacillus yonginensis TaxID=1462996 RepID=A0A1B1N6C0_9BACL|nr:hypothetical protein [Paenibacillus yonginensis]ANS76969.1 hypothetical protein AWM70_22255 [Paenibacillus yonginensis]